MVMGIHWHHNANLRVAINNYDIIQPYIEKIDAKFIDIMNNRIRNI